ncbi:MAG: alpha/beta hydrolase, partial [Gemmatimonadetes bacterium]|nr:alpha/beta hydrolase [Gemmatimonadota bacterium]
MTRARPGARPGACHRACLRACHRALLAAALAWAGCAPAKPPAPSAARAGALDGALVEDTAVRVVADDGTVLAGTLLRPAGDAGRRGAVLLLSGSGAQDRDGARPELPGYRPLAELAAAFARAGVVTLRLDDRGTGGSGGRLAGRTTDDAARDAAAAVRWLRAHPAVAPGRVALAGHSEGALAAMLAARADPAVCALVLLGA